MGRGVLCQFPEEPHVSQFVGRPRGLAGRVGAMSSLMAMMALSLRAQLWQMLAHLCTVSGPSIVCSISVLGRAASNR